MFVRISLPEDSERPAPRTAARANRAPASSTRKTAAETHPARTFRDVYCARFAIAPERFDIHLMQRSLPWHARVLRPVLTVVARNYFSLDLSFIRAVGRAATAKDLRYEIEEFRHDPRNRSWLRTTQRVRVSTNRLLNLVEELLPHLSDEPRLRTAATRPPFN